MHLTKNDLPAAVRVPMIEMLNLILADAIALQTQAKQAHWNVKGPHFIGPHFIGPHFIGLHFIGLHRLFDEVSDAPTQSRPQWLHRRSHRSARRS